MEGVSLPKVTPAIGDVIIEEMRKAGGNNYLENVLHQMHRENPYLAIFLDIHAKSSQNSLEILYTGMLIYKMLANQAEVDNLKENF